MIVKPVRVPIMDRVLSWPMVMWCALVVLLDMLVRISSWLHPMFVMNFLTTLSSRFALRHLR